jgi:hypothetical protein
MNQERFSIRAFKKDISLIRRDNSLIENAGSLIRRDNSLIENAGSSNRRDNVLIENAGSSNRRDNNIKYFTKWRLNNIMAFFLSIRKSGIEYNKDILILILSHLNLKDLTHPNVEDIKKNNHFIYFCQSSYVVSKLDRYKILNHIRSVDDVNLNKLIFKDINLIKFFFSISKRYEYKYMKYIDMSIFKNKDNILNLIPIFPKSYLFDYIPEEFKFDRCIIFKVLTCKQYSEKYLRAIFTKYGKDKDMIEEILKIRPELYTRVSRYIRRDKDILVMCVTKYPPNMNYIPEKYRYDFDLLKRIYKNNKACGSFMSSNLDFITSTRRA